MAKIITLDEMLTLVSDDDYCRIVPQIQVLANELADIIARNQEIHTTGATVEYPEFGGTAAAFYQKYEGQELPEDIEALDPEGDWELPPDVEDADT
jgi:hypothetical protein